VIPFLLVVVAVIVVGATVLAYRHRPESSIESGIRSFRREMRALAPPADQRHLRDDEPPPPPGGPEAR
jgi:hypothetical protein